MTKEQKHLIWCPVGGWQTEAWCKEVRDPDKNGPCYHYKRNQNKRNKLA